MLEKKYKLAKTDNIKNIISRGETHSSPYFIIKTKETDDPHSRFAIVVSTKLSKKAVNRNRLRRQLFEIIRLNIEKTSMASPHKIVILPRAKALKLDYKNLEKNLLKTFKL